MEAMYYTKLADGVVQCQLCPHRCTIQPGRGGLCRMRVNLHGTLESLNWGRIVSVSMDPIEKKPLYHFHPGRQILSLGSLGCNLRCFFCQNYEISQALPETCTRLTIHHPDTFVAMALREPGNLGIAFTYNEPTVWYEYMLQTATLAQEEGLKTVMVTNGYINPEPLAQLLPFIDAFNVDLKGFTNDFYRKHTGATLEPVLQTLKQIRAAGKHLEVTTLAIPTLNDDPEVFAKEVDWLADELGPETILHLSRYFPRYRCTIAETPRSTLARLQGIALKRLRHVHLGNV